MKKDTAQVTADHFKSLFKQYLWDMAFSDLIEARTAGVWESPEYVEGNQRFSTILSNIPKEQASLLEEVHLSMLCDITRQAFISGLYTGIQNASPYGTGPVPKASA